MKTSNTLENVHTNHLNNISMVHDTDSVISQAISYIPYGEVFVEQQAGGWSSPYLFNAKELDSETGLYYYGARYLDPSDAMWLSVDPLWEEHAGMSCYAYCMGNPVRLVDPDGKYETYYNIDGEAIGQGTNADSKARVVITNKQEAKNIKKAYKNGEQTELQQTNSAYQLPSDATLNEAIDVLDRTIANGGVCEEVSVVSKSGNVTRGEQGDKWTDGSVAPTASLPTFNEDISNMEASIHSHPTIVLDGRFSPADIIGDGDPSVFSSFDYNIIVGKGNGEVTHSTDKDFGRVLNDTRSYGYGFYGRKNDIKQKCELWLSKKALKKIMGKK